MTPPSQDDIQQLLNQEYAEFQVKVRERGDSIEQDFVIRELPLEAELRLVKAVKKTLGARVKEISSIEWANTTTALQKIVRIMEMVPGAVDTLADCTAVCLDPFSENDKITGEWVKRNINATKMAGILAAQHEASRYRDFLSLAYRLMPGMTS